MRFNHVGIPTTGSFDGEIPLPHLKMTVSDHMDNPFGIQWQRYWDGAPYPDLVKTVPHVAFEVGDLAAVLEGHHVIIDPNSPSPGVTVAFIEVRGHPSSSCRSITRPARTCSQPALLTRHRARAAGGVGGLRCSRFTPAAQGDGAGSA